MTLSAIITSALAQLDRGEDPQLVTKYESKFTQYANDAVLDMAKDFPLHFTESVTLDGGKFYTTDLSKWATKILSVKQDGEAVDWDLGDELGEIVCVDAVGEELTGSVDVKYKYVPSAMTSTSDIPGIPEQLHRIIVTYVVARDKASGDPTTQGASTIYFQLYERQKSGMMLGGLGAPSQYKFINR